MRSSDAPPTPGVLDILTRAESVLVLTTYTALFVLATIWLIRRRDLV